MIGLVGAAHMMIGLAVMFWLLAVFGLVVGLATSRGRRVAAGVAVALVITTASGVLWTRTAPPVTDGARAEITYYGGPIEYAFAATGAESAAGRDAAEAGVRTYEFSYEDHVPIAFGRVGVYQFLACWTEWSVVTVPLVLLMSFAWRRLRQRARRP